MYRGPLNEVCPPPEEGLGPKHPVPQERNVASKTAAALRRDQGGIMVLLRIRSQSVMAACGIGQAGKHADCVGLPEKTAPSIARLPRGGCGRRWRDRPR